MVYITAFMTLLGKGFEEDEASVLQGGALLPTRVERCLVQN